MKIVASNSITVSNVNDGTITHTAWSNSADGTDGFTTVYPNLNLLTDSKEFKNKTIAENAVDTSITSYDSTIIKEGNETYLHYLRTNSNYNDWFRAFLVRNGNPNFPNVDVKGNTQYTFSVWLRGTGTHVIYAYAGWTEPWNANKTITLTKEWKLYTFTVLTRSKKELNTKPFIQFFIRSDNVGSEINLKKPKVEQGSFATLYMQTESEVTTADWPSYIGQYTDFTQDDSTNPSAYTWSLIRGNDGERGPQGLKGDPGATGIPGQAGADGKTSYLHIAYATNSTGTVGFDVSNATGKTYIGQYTDFTSADSTDPSKYTWSLIKGDKGDKGERGIQGPAGSNGDPGKTVSNTEPSTRFKGLTWKYSGTTDLTASDGTVIKPNTEYYYNGTHWVINYFSVNNFAAESITSDKIDGKNLTITDGEFISKTTNGPVTTSTEIKDNHIAISKTDGTVNTRNDIALDSEQGLAQKFTNINTGFYRTAGINYQGPFTSDSDGNFAQLTPQGTKLSTDVPWTKLSLMNNFNGNIEYAIINGTVYISASGVGVPSMSAGQWKQAAQLPAGSLAIPIRANRIAAGDSGDGLSWALLSNQAGGIFIRCSGNKSPTLNLFNATLPYPIG